MFKRTLLGFENEGVLNPAAIREEEYVHLFYRDMEKAGFSITGKFNRNEWGLVWNSAMQAGGIMVSDEVHISCEIELINLGSKDLKMTVESKPTNPNKSISI